MVNPRLIGFHEFGLSRGGPSLRGNPMPGELCDNRGRGEAEWNWPAIHPEGRKFGLIGIAASVVLWYLLGWFLAWPMLILSVGVFAFFRDPERVVPQGDDLIVAPADGLVTLIS